MDRETLTAFHGILIAQLQQFLSGLQDGVFEVECRNSLGPMDEADLASVRSESEMLLALRQRSNLAVREILEALHRLKAGEFGLCEECGMQIGLMRLRAQPTASVCIDCKKEIEAEERKIIFQKAS